MRHRLAIVVSHPIQHFVPFYRTLAANEEIDLTVLFGSRIGLKPYFDQEMNVMIAWNMDLLSSYKHAFLSNNTGPVGAAVDSGILNRELKRVAPDAVLIHGYSQPLARQALRWCRHRVPALMISDSELEQARAPLKLLFKRIVLPQILRKFTAFLAVGDNNEAYYQHYGVPNAQIFRSPFTIDEDTYKTARANRAALRTRVRAEFGIADDAVVALTVGKLSKRKRQVDLIEAAHLLAKRGTRKPVHFLLAGDGEEVERLQAAAQDLPVTLAGFVNVDRLPSFYAAADMLVHPSEKDPHPLVLSEGACMGLPLLVSHRVGAAGVSDIARPGLNTIVFAVSDTAAIAEAVAGLADDPPRLATMARASLEIYEQLDMRSSVAGLRAALTFACA